MLRSAVPGQRTGSVRWAAVVAAVALALVASVLSAPPPIARAATPAPTGGFSLGSGLGGTIDPRTGQASAGVPIAVVRGNGHAGIQIQLDWQQERAAAGLDRSGWGAGWSLGTTFVSVVGLKRVYPATGGSYLLDSAVASGLKNYKLRDLTFSSVTGKALPYRDGVGTVAYAYQLRYDDGRIDYFNTDGNLVARIDRFANRTDLSWQPRAGGIFRPVKIIDSYGLATTFDYSTPNQIKVALPERSDGVQPVSIIALTTGQGVQTVTDPVGNKTVFGYASVAGAPKPLLSQITGPSGGRAAITYRAPGYQPSLVVVDTLKVTDTNGNQLSASQTFDLDPAGNNRHNFTGFPSHAGPEALFGSGDAAYTYRTGITTGATTTISTFDALNRLVSRTFEVKQIATEPAVLAQTHAMTYPTPVIPPGGLPADFGRPSTVRLTQSSATDDGGIRGTASRTTSSSTEYDDHGRLTSATDEAGTITTTEYDDQFGLITKQTSTGADGTQAQQMNVLTADGRNIASTTKSVGQDGSPLSARQTTSYTYDPRSGEVATRRLSWAPGAAPDDAEPGDGPDEIVTTFARTTSLDGLTQTLTTVAGAGSDAAKKTTTTLDLVSGLVMENADAMGRVTTAEYDAVGRRTRLTTPDGFSTRTAYTPTQTVVTGPTGRSVRSTTDKLGRTVSVTDNVAGGRLVADVGARTLSATSFSADGLSLTATDQAGRETTTTMDAFGRAVRKVGPTGLVQTMAFDDGAAHTRTAEIIPAGSDDPQSTMTARYDDTGRVVQSQTSHNRPPLEPLTEPVAKSSFDGLGQPVATTRDDVTVNTDRSGIGGTESGSVATPGATDQFPGQPVSATTTTSLTGDTTSRTLRQGTAESRAVAMDYDELGQVVAATDPEDRRTEYTYTADGQIETKTSPSGATTRHVYDDATGLLSRVEFKAPGKPDRTVSYTRVPAGQLGAGQVKTVTDGSGTMTYAYDADGHRTSVGYPDGTSASATYNAGGQVATLTDVTGAVTSYVYDPEDAALTSATQKRGAAVLASVTYGYDALSRVATITRGNGSVTTNTYTADNLLAGQVTATGAGTVLEQHGYTYDSHQNLASRVDNYAAGGSAAVPGAARTWSTLYDYDAFDRLVRSAVYAGPMANGQPSGPAYTTTTYTVDLGSDVTATSTTRRTPGPRPFVTTSTVTNTIDDSGRLIAQQRGSQRVEQTFDDDGRVLQSLAGAKISYGSDGSETAAALPDGSSVSYTKWPNGTRRSTTTRHSDGTSSTSLMHYSVDGNLMNDSTSDVSTGTGSSTTASYLLTASREARTLLPRTNAAGAVSGTPAAAVTTGVGVGYYLRDRHSSVTAQLDSSGAVTGTYGYADYGAPTRADGRPVSLPQVDGGRTNPYTYTGAAARGPWTDAASGLLDYGLRSYDPGQGRFTSPDPVDGHNRYQGFRTNPIMYADLGGGISIIDAVMDSVFAAIFLVTAVVTGFAAVAAIGALFGVATAVTGAVVANAVFTAGAALGNLAAGVTSVLLASDDVVALKDGKKEGWLSAQDRSVVQTVNAGASAVAGASGIGQALTDGAAGAFRAINTATKVAEANRGANVLPRLWVDPLAVVVDPVPLQPNIEIAAGAEVPVVGDVLDPPEIVPEEQPPPVPTENNGTEPTDIEKTDSSSSTDSDSSSDSGSDSESDDAAPTLEPEKEALAPEKVSPAAGESLPETIPTAEKTLDLTDIAVIQNSLEVPQALQFAELAEKEISPRRLSVPNTLATSDPVTTENSAPVSNSSPPNPENFVQTNTQTLVEPLTNGT